MLKIYGNPMSPPANKVTLCANALGLDFEFVPVDLRGGEQKTADHLVRHPAGKVPAIDDDGFMVFESDAIMQYLCRKQKSDLYPEGLKERAIVEQWAYFAANHIMVNMGRLLFNKVFAPMMGMEVDTRALQDGEKFLGQFLPVLEKQLEKSTHLALGHLTLADITLLAALDPVEMVKYDISQYPKIVAWRNNLKKQAFYQKTHAFYGASLQAA